MTVSSATSRWEYTGNGVTDEFAYTTRIFDADDLDVYVDGVLKTRGTHYTVDGVDDGDGGNVTFEPAHVPADGDDVVIVKDVPAVQDLDLEPLGDLPPDLLEAMLDKLMILQHQAATAIARCLQLSDAAVDSGLGSIPAVATRKGKLWQWDATTGEIGLAVPADLDISTVSAYVETLLGQASAAAFRTAIGLAIGTDVLAPTGSGASLTGVLLTGKQCIGAWGAEALKPPATNGCAALAWDESSTNDVMTPYLAFDKDAIEYAQFKFRAPQGLDESAGFTALVLWKENSGASAHDCVWTLEMQAQGDGDTIDSAWGTGVSVTDTGASGKRQIAPAFAAITPGGTWAAGDEILVRVSRKATDAADTLDVDGHLIEVVLFATYAAGAEP